LKALVIVVEQSAQGPSGIDKFGLAVRPAIKGPIALTKDGYDKIIHRHRGIRVKNHRGEDIERRTDHPLIFDRTNGNESVDPCRIGRERLMYVPVGIPIGEYLSAKGGPKEFPYLRHFAFQFLLCHPERNSPSVGFIARLFRVAYQAEKRRSIG